MPLTSEIGPLVVCWIRFQIPEKVLGLQPQLELPPETTASLASEPWPVTSTVPDVGVIFNSTSPADRQAIASFVNEALAVV